MDLDYGPEYEAFRTELRAFLEAHGHEAPGRRGEVASVGSPELVAWQKRLIARGYAYKEIALELSISIKTVETHVSAVLRKLQLSNRHQLTRWATERRLV